jgi:hypothetical protein
VTAQRVQDAAADKLRKKRKDDKLRKKAKTPRLGGESKGKRRCRLGFF